MLNGPDRIDPERVFFLATSSEHLAKAFGENSPTGVSMELSQALQDMDSANTPSHLVNYFQKRINEAIARGEEPSKLDLQDLWNAKMVLGAQEAGYPIPQDFDLW